MELGNIAASGLWSGEDQVWVMIDKLEYAALYAILDKFMGKRRCGTPVQQETAAGQCSSFPPDHQKE